MSAQADIRTDIERGCTRVIYWCERAKRILAEEPVCDMRQAEREADALRS